ELMICCTQYPTAQGIDDMLHPISYCSRKFNIAERNYSIYENEGLARVESESTERTARWLNTLSEYRFVVKHREGKDNVVAEYLSRDASIILSTIVKNTSKHLGFETIYGWIRERYWRPRLRQEKFSGKSSISGILEVWSFNFLGPFPVNNNHNRYIINAVERLSGYPYAKAYPHKQLTFDYKINRKINLPYHSEWMGQVENMNIRIRYALTKTCGLEMYRWEESLLPVKNTLSTDSYLRKFKESVIKGIRKSIERDSISSTKNKDKFEVGEKVVLLRRELRKKGYDNALVGRSTDVENIKSAMREIGVSNPICGEGYLGYNCYIYGKENVAKMSCFLKGKPGVNSRGITLYNDPENTGLSVENHFH
ncbi:hypothetical protein BB561_000308, partial [Smittium simulii]